MTSSHFRAGDVDAMLRIVDDGRRDDPAEAMPWAVLEDLQRLVPCDNAVMFCHSDLHECRDTIAQGISCGMRFVDDDPCGPDDPFWSFFWGSRYCSYPQTAGDLVSVIQEADFYGTDQERRNDPMQNELMAPIGCVHSMTMSMPAPAGQMRRLLFARASGPGFSERDRQVVSPVAPAPLRDLVGRRTAAQQRAPPHRSGMGGIAPLRRQASATQKSRGNSSSRWAPSESTSSTF